MLAGSAQAKTATIGGIEYTVRTVRQAAVTDANENITTADIPATVNINGTDYPVTAIGERAFYTSPSFPQPPHRLQSITLPESLQSIGEWAFSSFLRNIDCLAATPPAIEESTFDDETYHLAILNVPVGSEDAYRAADGWSKFYLYTPINGISYTCNEETQTATIIDAEPSITTAVIPATVNIDGTDYPVTAIDAWAFSDCTALQSVTFPEGLQSIGNGAFDGCPLTNIICHASTPPNISRIPIWPFTPIDPFDASTYYRANLTVPQEAEEAYRTGEGWKKFYLYTTIDSIVYTYDTETMKATVFDAFYITIANILATVDIDGANCPVTTIDDDAFSGCTALQSVTIPEGVTSIGSKAFYDCYALQSVTFPERLQSIGRSAFNGCRSLQIITLPEGLQTIESGAFIGCDALQSVIFPEGLQTIGNQAFSGCTTLQNIIFANGLQIIDDDAFNGCTALQSITLPEGLQTIGSSAFYGCTNLRSVTLPDGLQTINDRAFSDCKLTDIICHASTPPVIEGDTFDEVYYFITTLHVPSDAVAKYQTAECWKEFFHVEAIIPTDIFGSVAADASLVTYANGILATKSPADITVYAQSGAVVRHATDATSLSLAGLPRGIYIISIAQDGQRKVMKVAR